MENLAVRLTLNTTKGYSKLSLSLIYIELATYRDIVRIAIDFGNPADILLVYRDKQ